MKDRPFIVPTLWGFIFVLAILGAIQSHVIDGALENIKDLQIRVGEIEEMLTGGASRGSTEGR